jgi:hypothetical protein
MNMRKLAVYGGALALLTASLSSCDDAEGLGADLRPDDLTVKTEYIDNFVLQAETRLADAPRTMNLSRLLVGNYSHPFFGRTTATAYAQVLPSAVTDTIILVSNSVLAPLVFDSVRFDVQFNYFYGTDAQARTTNFLVHELASDLDTTGGHQYTAADALEKGPLLAQKSVEFTSEVLNTRFDLPYAFGLNLFEKIQAKQLVDRASFAAELPGLVISTDGQENAMYGLQPQSVATTMRLYYHYIDVDDTVSLTLPLYMGLYFHQLEADRSGTPLAALTQENPLSSAALGNQMATQAGHNVLTRIVMPDLSEYSLINKRAINRAELIMAPVRGSVPEGSPPPTTFYFAETDANGDFTEDSNGSYNYLISRLGREVSMSYTSGGQSFPIVDVTDYVEELANDRRDNTGFILHAREQASSTINHLILGDSRHPGNYPLQLRIYYTDFE